MAKDLLRSQLERVRFEKAIDYISINAHGKKHLNAQELALINSLMTSGDSDPWRSDAAEVVLPTGTKATFSVISNPLLDVRNILSNAQTVAANGDLEIAAAALYSQLVLGHFFKDANRRTAVAATYWLLLEKGIRIPPVGLLDVGLGDLRSSDHAAQLKTLIHTTIQIAQSRQPEKT